MSFRISGRNMNLGEALTQRIEERVADVLEKYFEESGYSGHATVEKQGSLFEADCMVHLDTGMVLQASAKAQDATSSFEQAADRIEKRLRRYKRKLRDHARGRDKGFADVEANLTVMSTAPRKRNWPRITHRSSSPRVRPPCARKPWRWP